MSLVNRGRVSVGKRLKECRAALGLKQAELAEQCGITREQQGRFERDDNAPGGAYLIAAAALGVDVGYVLTGRTGTRDEPESELLQRFRAASSDVQGAVLRALGIATSGKKKASVAISGGSQGQVIAGDLKQRDVTFNVGTSKKKAPK